MASGAQTARRAMVLDDSQLVVDLIRLTPSHGQFVVRAARSLAEADAILAEWRPNIALVDMAHDDSTDLRKHVGRRAPRGRARSRSSA